MLVVGHGLVDAGLPVAGHKQLLQLPLAIPHQIQRGVKLTASTATGGLAAGALAGRQRAVQQPAAMDELRDAGAEPTFGIREMRASGGRLHDWYN